MKKINDTVLFGRSDATADRGNTIDANNWFVPHYTPNVTELELTIDHIVSETPTELSYQKTSLFIKVIQHRSEKIFQLGLNSGTGFRVFLK